MTNTGITLAVFLGLEDAFGKTSFESMIFAANNGGVEDTISKWIMWRDDAGISEERFLTGRNWLMLLNNADDIVVVIVGKMAA